MTDSDTLRWRLHGVRVIPGDQLDTNTPQTPGMNRAAAITQARVGADKLWAGTVVIHPNAKTGAHHHGPVESVIYVVRGRARMRWGDRLEFCAEAGPGDFIYVPPFVPHQEINADPERRARVRARTQRPGAGRGEPGHRARGAAGVCAVDRSASRGSPVNLALSGCRDCALNQIDNAQCATSNAQGSDVVLYSPSMARYIATSLRP